MTTWEYATIDVPVRAPERTTEILDSYGREGWEVACVVTIPGEFNMGIDQRFILKRPYNTKPKKKEDE